jgi:hypothetical protein
VKNTKQMKKLSDPIDQRQRKSGSISNLLDGYMDRFTVYKSDTLFDPDYSLLITGHCILCSCKLKYIMRSKLFICNSKKHRKPFIIKEKRLYEIQQGAKSRTKTT